MVVYVSPRELRRPPSPFGQCLLAGSEFSNLDFRLGSLLTVINENSSRRSTTAKTRASLRLLAGDCAKFGRTQPSPNR